jgi:dihydropyrimidinase
MWPRKGALQPGSDADLVVYDPEPVVQVRAEELHHRAGYSPYEGMDVHGHVRATVSRGEVIYRDGRFIGKKGRGQFVRRQSLQVADRET